MKLVNPRMYPPENFILVETTDGSSVYGGPFWSNEGDAVSDITTREDLLGNYWMYAQGSTMTSYKFIVLDGKEFP